MAEPTQWVAFLRGVNVNGITVKSAPLRAAFDELGFHEVRTVLATGNVVFAASGTLNSLKAQIENKLRESFGYAAWIVLRTAPDVEALVQACTLPERDGWHTYVLLASDPAVLAELAGTATDPAHDTTAAGKGVLYWQVQQGHSTDSPFAKVVSRARYRSSTTTRNLHTMRKIVAVAG